jgi:hypothetical protein
LFGLKEFVKNSFKETLFDFCFLFFVLSMKAVLLFHKKEKPQKKKTFSKEKEKNIY